MSFVSEGSKLPCGSIDGFGGDSSSVCTGTGGSLLDDLISTFPPEADHQPVCAAAAMLGHGAVEPAWQLGASADGSYPLDFMSSPHPARYGDDTSSARRPRK